MMENPRASALRTWAEGLLPLEAAVELLVCSMGGRLLDGPWVRKDPDGRFWFDPDMAAAGSGYLSGGEQRVLAVAASLASSDHPVDLGDAITGIDHGALALVLDALAHAGGLTSELNSMKHEPPLLELNPTSQRPTKEISVTTQFEKLEELRVRLDRDGREEELTLSPEELHQWRAVECLTLGNWLSKALDANTPREVAALRRALGSGEILSQLRKQLALQRRDKFSSVPETVSESSGAPAAELYDQRSSSPEG